MLSCGKDGLALSRADQNEKWETFDYRLAHHPTCDRFHDHFYHALGKKWCRGCVMMYSGNIIGLFITPLLLLHLNYQWDHAIMWAFVLPTLISAYLKPARWIRDITRFLLGVGIVLAFGLIIVGLFTSHYLTSALVLGSYLFLSDKLSGKRSESNRLVCEDCSELDNPRCPGFKDFYDRQMIQQSGEIRLDVFSE